MVRYIYERGVQMKALNYDKLMDADERNKVVEVLEARKIRFHFTKCSILLFFKGRRDTRKDKVIDEVKRYFAIYQKFVEEEYKFLIKKITPTIIAVQTAKSRIEKAKKNVETPMDTVHFDDERKQKRADQALQSKKNALQSAYLSELKQYDEARAFLDITLNIVVRLCLSAYEYMFECLELYLKYVSVSCEEVLPKKEVTFETIYADFVSAIKGGSNNEEE